MNTPIPHPLQAEEFDDVEMGNAAPKEPRPTPSWFPRPANSGHEELAGRYRTLAPERPRPAPGLEPRPVMTAAQLDARTRYYREFPHAADDQYREPRRQSLRGAYVMAGVLAVLVGGGAGLAAARLDDITRATQHFVASLLAPAVGQPAIATADNSATTVPKKLVTTATLDVADASGGLNSYIPLMLHAEPAADGADITLRLSGLPREAYLTAGNKAANNDWVLNLQEAGGVKLVVPRSETPKFDVAVAAVDSKSGQLAAPVKELTVAIDDANLQITPVSAAPEVKVEEAAVSGDQAGVADLLQKGDLLLKSGDLTTARQFYERAFTLGAADGALGAGKTYDPAVYKAMNVQGLTPDPVRAMEWYMRASAAGQIDASAAIVALKTATQ